MVTIKLVLNLGSATGRTIDFKKVEYPLDYKIGWFLYNNEISSYKVFLYEHTYMR